MALRSVLSLARRPLWAAAAPAPAPAPAAVPALQCRTYWQEVVRTKVDRGGGGRTRYEDPEQASMRSRRASKSEGLLRRRFRYVRYEKPWMKKKRLAGLRAYRVKERGVAELKMYIKFMQEGGGEGGEGAGR